MKGITASGRGVVAVATLTLLSTSVVSPTHWHHAGVPSSAEVAACHGHGAGPPPHRGAHTLRCPLQLGLLTPEGIVAAPSPGMAFLLPSGGRLVQRCRSIPTATIESRAGPPTALYLLTHRLLI